MTNQPNLTGKNSEQLRSAEYVQTVALRSIQLTDALRGMYAANMAAGYFRLPLEASSVAEKPALRTMAQLDVAETQNPYSFINQAVASTVPDVTPMTPAKPVVEVAREADAASRARAAVLEAHTDISKTPEPIVSVVIPSEVVPITNNNQSMEDTARQSILDAFQSEETYHDQLAA